MKSSYVMYYIIYTSIIIFNFLPISFFNILFEAAKNRGIVSSHFFVTHATVYIYCCIYDHVHANYLTSKSM